MTNNYMPHENRKTKIKCMSWECFNQTLNYYENKIRKKLNLKTFCRMESKNFQAKVWKVSLENTAIWKILAFSLNLCAPNKLAQISVGNPSWVQHDRLSTQEWCDCEK